MRISTRALVTTARLALAILALGTWEWATYSEAVSPLLLSSPADVVSHLVTLIGGQSLWEAVGVTAVETVAAFGIALVLGLSIGAIGGSRQGAAVLEPLIGTVQIVPIVLLYPILVLLLGLGISSKIAFGGVGGSLPIALNTMRGFARVDPRYVRCATSLGATRRQLIRHVKVPAALPSLFAGVQLGAGLTLIGVLTAEILASTGGLGYRIAESSALFDTADMYAYIVVVITLVGAFNGALVLGTRYALRISATRRRV